MFSISLIFIQLLHGLFLVFRQKFGKGIKAHLAHEAHGIHLLLFLCTYLQVFGNGWRRGSSPPCFVKCEQWFSTMVGGVVYVTGY